MKLRRRAFSRWPYSPVFLKRAVVAGGSDGAACKAELLAAAGARVEVYALTADLSEGTRRLTGRPVATSVQAG
jgi:hypothetical protein